METGYMTYNNARFALV